jgi:hypothetical protein
MTRLWFHLHCAVEAHANALTRALDRYPDDVPHKDELLAQLAERIGGQ